MIDRPIYVCTYPLDMLNHFGVAACSCCQKCFNLAHSADRVMPRDLAHILQQACATVHNSWNPRQTENPPGPNSLAGNYDRLTPPAGLDRIDAELRSVYEAQGASEAWRLIRYDIGHFETAAMRAEIVSFLERWL